MKNIQQLSNEELLLARIFTTHTVNEIATEQNRRSARKPLITTTIATRFMASVKADRLAAIAAEPKLSQAQLAASNAAFDEIMSAA